MRTGIGSDGECAPRGQPDGGSPHAISKIDRDPALGYIPDLLRCSGGGGDNPLGHASCRVCMDDIR